MVAVRGINKAKNKYNNLYESTFNLNNSQQEKKCVFLSHASKDKDAARKIGDYIMKAGVDIYLDENDSDLQKALESENNHAAVTRCIENGIRSSTDILCIVSEATKLSWWVPYEIGYGKKSDIGIGTLLLNDVKDIPSYLKITRLLSDIYDLNKYLDELASTVTTTEAYKYKSFETGKLHHDTKNHPLSDYVKQLRLI